MSLLTIKYRTDAAILSHRVGTQKMFHGADHDGGTQHYKQRIIRVTFIPYPLHELIKPLASVSERDLFCVFFQEHFRDNCEQQLFSPLTLTQLTQRK